MPDQVSRVDGPTVCIAENRASCEPALRVLVASLARHCPDVPAILFCPNATPAFAAWIASTHAGRMSLNPFPLDGPWTKYDIKPLALLSVLNTGASDVIWIDSDILIARDFMALLGGLSPATLAVAEEALSGSHADPDGLRARLWGLETGRTLPFAVNTGVLRVTRDHRSLLQDWHDKLQSDAYRNAQAAPWTERPPHLAGDQEVMTALLASARYASVPVRFLRRGRDIVQFFGSSGYTVAERVRHIGGGLPPFVHSQGFHPWWPQPAPPSRWGARFGALYGALSPYTVLAREYADSLEDTAWLRPASPLAAMLTTRSAPLAGLPLALIADTARWGKRAISAARGRGVPAGMPDAR